MDFVGKCRTNNLILTDWKTGRDDDENETELQMAAYVLWAREYYKMNTDEISTELVFLKTGATKPYAFSMNSYASCGDNPPVNLKAMNASK